MGIADREAALVKLHEFLRLQHEADRYLSYEVPQAIRAAIDKMEPLIEDIASALGEQRVGDVVGDTYVAIAVTNRLIGTLENSAVREQILGPVGPTLAANRLHPWVWGAAANLWDDGHYIAAVDAAYKKVELQTQQKLRASKRRSGSDLFAQAFSLEDPKPDKPRLRFPHIDRAEALETWKSAHEGAMHVGMGCAKGIRNSLAHPTEDTSETGEDEKQEPLEQLAALSVLARWVDACEVVVAS